MDTRRASVRRACACTRVKSTHITVIAAVAFSLPQTRGAEVTMLMFKRSQMYIAFALAALAEIIVRAFAR